MNKIGICVTLILNLLMVSPGQGETGRQICVFKLHGFEMEESVEQEIQEGALWIMQFYETVLGFTFSEDFQISVRIFKSRNSYIQHRNEYGSNISIFGYYSKKYKEVITWKSQRLIPVVFHEVSHALLDNHVLCPKWLDEGLANYLENIRVRDDKTTIDFYHNWDQHCKRWLEDGSMMPLGDYIAMTMIKKYREKWVKEVSRQGYEQPRWSMAWSFVYFLMSSEEGQETLKNIVWQMKKEIGNDRFSLLKSFWFLIPYNAVAIVERGISGDLEMLEQKWHAWIPQKRQVHAFSF